MVWLSDRPLPREREGHKPPPSHRLLYQQSPSPTYIIPVAISALRFDRTERVQRRSRGDQIAVGLGEDALRVPPAQPGVDPSLAREEGALAKPEQHAHHRASRRVHEDARRSHRHRGRRVRLPRPRQSERPQHFGVKAGAGGRAVPGCGGGGRGQRRGRGEGGG